MNKDVANVLGELRQDHKNMSLLLDILEREANRLFDGEETDFDLLHDIMEYMTVYPDAVHHPKEDRIYAELKLARPELTTGFDRITLDHRNIEELGTKLRDELATLVAGGTISSKSVVADALRYVNTLRGHMQWEELDLFRRVEDMVAEGHDLIEATTLLQESDPVFGPAVEKRFAPLVDRVRERAAAEDL